MPDIAPSVPLVALIPAQRVTEIETIDGVASPAPVPTAPERLAFLWTALGVLAGSAVVAAGFLVLLVLLP